MGVCCTKCRTRLLFSDIYPGSISDSEIIEMSMVLEFVEQGFAIQNLCAEIGVFLNRPKKKDSDQFTGSEVQRNFDIVVWEIGGF